MSNQKKQSAETAVRDIRRRTRRKFSPEEKIRIVLEGLRGEQSASELCRREGIAANSVLPLEQGFPRSREEAAGRGHGPGSHQQLGLVAQRLEERLAALAVADPVLSLWPGPRGTRHSAELSAVKVLLNSRSGSRSMKAR